MRQVLNDSLQEKQFHQDGFITLKLLDVHQLDQLQHTINELNQSHIDQSIEENSSYKLSYFNGDLEFKQKVFNTLSDFFQPTINQHLKNYKPLIINIFDKEPGKGEVTIHQNWTFVDEEKYTSVSVWIPLVDVSRNNGTLETVKGSHKVLCKYRSPSLPWVFDEINDILKEKYLEPFVIKKGEAAIIDDGILHWSSDNYSEHVRTAVQLIMIPEDATAIHYVNKGDHVDIYEVDPLFFMQYDIKNIPEGYNIIGEMELSLKKMNEKEFVDIVAQNDPTILEKYESKSKEQAPKKKIGFLEKVFGS